MTGSGAIAVSASVPASWSTTETAASSTGLMISATAPTFTSSELWLRKSPKARAAAADRPIAARLKKTTAFLRRASASSPDETPSQMWAGTSSCPLSRMDLIWRSHSLLFCPSNIFYFSILFCSQALALLNCVLDVVSVIPSISAISLWEYPSIAYMLNTVLNPGGSDITSFISSL